MPILATSVVMDTEDFLHPEGPQLEIPKYNVSSPPLPNAFESPLFPSNPWSISQPPQYNQYSYPMQQSERPFQVNPSPVSELNSFSDVDFSHLTSDRNGDFEPDLSCMDALSNASLFSSTPDSLSEYADPSGFDIDSLSHIPSEGSTPAFWDTPGHSQRLLTRLPALSNLDEINAILNNQPGYKRSENNPAPPEEEEEADEEETVELGHVDTYAEYKPSKSTIGISHPDIVVETSTLSSVPPPDITYTLSIPETTIQKGLLSALQLEAIIYACQDDAAM